MPVSREDLSQSCLGSRGGLHQRTKRIGATNLGILYLVLRRYDPQHILLATLLHLAGQQELVQDEVGLLEVEDDVQFADVSVVLVHLLDIAVDDLEGDELVVVRITAGDEEEGCISTIDYLRI